MKTFTIAMIAASALAAKMYTGTPSQPSQYRGMPSPFGTKDLNAAIGYVYQAVKSPAQRQLIYDTIHETYDEGVKQVASLYNAKEVINKKIQNTYKMMPQKPVEVYVPTYEAQAPLLPYEALTNYDTYKQTGNVYLTDKAYTQAVNWKATGKAHYNPEPEYPREYPKALKGDYTGHSYYDKVPVLDERTGMVRLEQRLVENTYQHKPSYASYLTYEEPADMYSGYSYLPVEITNPNGVTRTGKQVEKDLKGDTKEVTLIDDRTGKEGVTLTLKDTENIVHIQELDAINAKKGTAGRDGEIDGQLVTVCDEVTDVCNLFEIELESVEKDEVNYAKPVETFYAPLNHDKAVKAVVNTEALIPQETVS